MKYPGHVRLDLFRNSANYCFSSGMAPRPIAVLCKESLQKEANE